MGVATIMKHDLSVAPQLLPKDIKEEKAAIQADEDKVKESTSPSDPVMDASLSGSEADSHASYRLRHQHRYPPGYTLKEDNKKARKRYLQHLDYTKLMECRMLDFERRLKAIGAIDTPHELRKTMPKRPEEQLTISLDIKRMTFAEYVPAMHLLSKRFTPSSRSSMPRNIQRLLVHPQN